MTKCRWGIFVTLNDRPKQMLHKRIFAVLVSVTATVSLFSMIGWTVVAVAAVAPVLITWAFVGAPALLFGFRLYRELRRS
jgi:hypothetical protein